MYTQLSAIDAFNAKQQGKNVVCRNATSNEYLPLNEVSAESFFDSTCIFAIKLETIIVGEIEFTKPLTPNDLKDGQEIYIVMPTCILRTKYDAEHSDIHHSVMNGFAQADAENALLQLQAFGGLIGNVIENVEVKDGFEEKPKRQRKPRETKITAVDIEVEKTPEESKQEFTSEDIQSNDVNADDFNENDPAIKSVLVAIEACKTEYYLDGVLGNLNGNKHKFHNDEYQELLKRIGAKRESIINESKNSVTELEKLKKDAEDCVYQEQLQDLIERASKAQTPAEANALVRYTYDWTEEQRAPLIRAISKRLTELPQPKRDETDTPLIIRLQKAPDLATLDMYETEIALNHKDVQNTLSNVANKRRTELTEAGV